MDFIRISRQRAADDLPHGGIIVSYHQYAANEIGAGVEIISRLMSVVEGEQLANCLYRLQDFR
jgi:hypothetical protein